MGNNLEEKTHAAGHRGKISAIPPGKKLEQLIDELKNTSPPTSDDHPFIVVAPTPAPHLPGQGKQLSCSRSPWNEKKCCFN